MICFACNKKIALGELLKCTGCKTVYHYICLNITSAKFTEQKTQLESSYRCDSCANITHRVRVTDDTPTRGCRSGGELIGKVSTKSCEETTFKENGTPSAINMVESIESITDMLKGEISARLNSIETKLIQEIKDSVATLVLENNTLREYLSVANKKCTTLEEEIKVLKNERIVTTQPNACTKLVCNYSYNQTSKEPVKEVCNSTTTQVSRAVVKRGPASATPAPMPVASLIPTEAKAQLSTTYAAVARNTADTAGAENINDKWIEVKNRNRNNPVKKGGNTSVTLLKAVERKKYLHVWRLDKSTTEDSIKEYIKDILGNNLEFTVEMIKTKTERNYSSFKIGLPENSFEKLCNPDVWPLNVEFSEWIFFRRPTTNTSNYPRTNSQ